MRKATSSTPSVLSRLRWTIQALLWSPIFSAAAADDITWKALLKADQPEIREQIHSANNCYPTFSSNSIQWCTIPAWGSEQVRTLQGLTRKSCEQAIRSKNYKIITSFNPKVITRKSWDQFSKSTKRAETLQAEQLVLLRKTASLADCVHELIHVKQYTHVDSSQVPLNPMNRDAALSRYESNLEQAANQIESLEKSGNPLSEADQAFTDEHLKSIKEYWSLHSTLDEKDPHALIYHGCTEKWWKCAPSDIENAAANLLRLSTVVPEGQLQVIRRWVGTRMKEREQQALQKESSTWKTLQPKEISKAKQVAQSNANSPSARIQTQETDIQASEDGKQCQIYPSAIPGSIWQFDFALLHAQASRNPQLCRVLREEKTAYRRYKSGLTSVNVYDDLVLRARALKKIAKEERESIHRSQSELNVSFNAPQNKGKHDE